MQLIIDLLEFLTPYGTYAYILMFLILLACGFGLPLPEDVVLITGGILSSYDVTNYWMTFAICMAGVLIGDGTIFFFGRTLGSRIKKTRLFSYLIKEERDLKIQYWFRKYGVKIIFLARFMPGLRTPLFLSAGIYKVSAWKFFLLDGFAALISVPAWIWIGFVFGENLEVLEKKMRQFQFGIYGILAGILGFFILMWFIKKKIMKTQSQIDPDIHEE